MIIAKQLKLSLVWEWKSEALVIQCCLVFFEWAFYIHKTLQVISSHISNSNSTK